MKILSKIKAVEITESEAKTLLKETYKHFGTLWSERTWEIFSKRGEKFFIEEQDPKTNYGIHYNVTMLGEDEKGCKLYNKNLYGSALTSAPLQRTYSPQFIFDNEEDYEPVRVFLKESIQSDIEFDDVLFYDEFFTKEWSKRTELAKFSKRHQFVLS